MQSRGAVVLGRMLLGKEYALLRNTIARWARVTTVMRVGLMLLLRWAKIFFRATFATWRHAVAHVIRASHTVGACANCLSLGSTMMSFWIRREVETTRADHASRQPWPLSQAMLRTARLTRFLAVVGAICTSPAPFRAPALLSSLLRSNCCNFKHVLLLNRPLTRYLGHESRVLDLGSWCICPDAPQSYCSLRTCAPRTWDDQICRCYRASEALISVKY